MQTVLIGGVPKILYRVPSMARVSIIRHPWSTPTNVDTAQPVGWIRHSACNRAESGSNPEQGMVVFSSGKEVGLSPVMDSYLEWKAAHPSLLYAGIIIGNKSVYSSVSVVCLCSSTCISNVSQDKKEV
ncbi:hypothetical protein TNCV_4450771 [Trichonephila clavipes]|nr:hypothetical protein TNCV_4450771 [Trichonephila clavipes]